MEISRLVRMAEGEYTVNSQEIGNANRFKIITNAGQIDMRFHRSVRNARVFKSQHGAIQVTVLE